MTLTPESVFGAALESHASDVHLVVGSKVHFRIDGVLQEQESELLSSEGLETFLKNILGTEQNAVFRKQRELDTSYELPDGTRFRINCHYERGNPGMAARIIPVNVPDISELGLTDIAEKFCTLQEGLILFTGPAGTGKSTSVASLLQYINTHGKKHIVTLEDPIEFLLPQGQGLVRQREYGDDFYKFDEALKRVLRQDPDVVFVGEMRDLETMATTLTLAETGHLVFATLHTPNTVQAVDRIIDVFPPHQQEQIRSQLSFTLKAVIAQRLLPKKEGGRVAQREIFVNTPAVSNIIRERRTQELASLLQTGKEHGMHTFAQDLERLLEEELISEDTFNQATEEKTQE